MSIKSDVVHLLVKRNKYIAAEVQSYRALLRTRSNHQTLYPVKLLYKVVAANFKYRILRRRIPKVSKPYMDGPECSVSGRPRPYRFAKSLLKYEVISFDVFDTLLLRPFSEPTALFMLVGEKLKILDFCRLRINAERKARQIALQERGTTEVTLEDIYSLIEEEVGIERHIGMQTEIEIELDLCFANPYMKEVFDILQGQGKRIVATSDMYLSGQVIRQILEKNGFYGIEHVFVSNEYGVCKRSQGLFKEVIRKLGCSLSEIVHIGDNHVADYLGAKKVGIEALLYRNVNEIGNRFRPAQMSPLIGSAYRGIANSYIHSGVNSNTVQFEYGFLCGGLYVLGYCSWITNYVEMNNIDKVLFLSRDGGIYQKVFNLLNRKRIPNEYLYWSRCATIRYALEKNRSTLFHFIRKKTEDIEKVSIEALLKHLNLSSLLPYLPNHGLSPSNSVTTENSEQLKKLIISNWQAVEDELKPEIDALREYLKVCIGDAESVALVDVGWLGTGVESLRYLIEEKFKMNCKVYSLLAASSVGDPTSNISNLMNDRTSSYLFSSVHNYSHWSFHCRTNKKLNNLLFEMVTQDTIPRFIGWRTNDGNSSAAFDFPEVENYPLIDQIHKGAYEFAKVYLKVFGSYPLMLNIPGQDAYMAFRLFASNIDFFHRHFQSFLLSQESFSDSRGQALRPLGELLAQAEL